MSVTFWALGRPRTKGSVHAFLSPKGNMIRKDSNPNTKAWAGVISHAADQAGVKPIEGGVSLTVSFWFCRPKSHYRSGKNAHLLKASAPRHPTSRAVGDVDKLLRAVLDALTGVAYVDDSAVAHVSATKDYLPMGEPEGANVMVGVFQ